MIRDNKVSPVPHRSTHPWRVEAKALVTTRYVTHGYCSTLEDAMLHYKRPGQSKMAGFYCTRIRAR